MCYQLARECQKTIDRVPRSPREPRKRLPAKKALEKAFILFYKSQFSYFFLCTHKRRSFDLISRFFVHNDFWTCLESVAKSGNFDWREAENGFLP